MDASIQRQLNDKQYDKRKQGAFELERLIRDAQAEQDYEKIGKIVGQLCHEHAYAVHQPHARNGGLIGLAAAAIALGTEGVARYLKDIVPPVLACFTDQDARVRYYACESMYNIAKVAKGEILLFFNDIFDALCKLAADSELSVKNGAELLDRLIKDIVSESATTYVSVLHHADEASAEADKDKDASGEDSGDFLMDAPPAFSLPKFIPLLQERIHVMNPFTRTFLVMWITLLDTIPDLELVSYLPDFLTGLLKFLSDPNRDVHVATQGVLDKFLTEIKKIARIKRGIAESRRGGEAESKAKQSVNSSETASLISGQSMLNEKSAIVDDEGDDDYQGNDEDWIPGQDVRVDHPKILEILVGFLDPASEEEIQLTALRWIDNFFEISSDDILPIVPRLLSQVLPALASGIDQVRQAANRVNNSLMDYIASLPDEPDSKAAPPPPISRVSTTALRDAESRSRQNSVGGAKSTQPSEPEPESKAELKEDESTSVPPTGSPSPRTVGSPKHTSDLDYGTVVTALTLHFLNEHEATRVAALAWLIMLHRKAPRKVLATNDGTFPALLKTLSDPAEAVVTRDLQLLSQISRNSDDSYFTSFMANLLQLFCTDRKLLETRGNLIIRQLCVSLSPERIYRILAETLEKDEDVEFASIMVQNLNNNLITAPELAELRKRLRNVESRDGQAFFTALFRTWCHNAVATFSLCLLAQAYEPAYYLLQVFAELEMTVNMLIQIDKLVQLLESPVFTYLRMQLLEPDRYPFLYKCLYGLLMLLPQSSAFAALKNRLNSVNAIGYLHMPSRTVPNTPTVPYDRPNRLKARDSIEPSGAIRWAELIDTFKAVQDRAKRARSGLPLQGGAPPPYQPGPTSMLDLGREKTLPDTPLLQISGPGGGRVAPGISRPASAEPGPPPSRNSSAHKSKSSLGNLGRLARGVGGGHRPKSKKQDGVNEK